MVIQYVQGRHEHPSLYCNIHYTTLLVVCFYGSTVHRLSTSHPVPTILTQHTNPLPCILLHFTTSMNVLWSSSYFLAWQLHIYHSVQYMHSSFSACPSTSTFWFWQNRVRKRQLAAFIKEKSVFENRPLFLDQNVLFVCFLKPHTRVCGVRVECFVRPLSTPTSSF